MNSQLISTIMYKIFVVGQFLAKANIMHVCDTNETSHKTKQAEMMLLPSGMI